MRKRTIGVAVVIAMALGSYTCPAGAEEFYSDSDYTYVETATSTDADVETCYAEPETDEETLEYDEMRVDATFTQINEDKVFIKQSERDTCTLTANTMMLRRNALIKGDSDWENITDAATRSTLWIEGTGMRWNYTYKGTSVKRASTEGMSAEAKEELFIALLAEHPEGVVIHDKDGSEPHAVLLTDYTNGVFYCADPSNGHPSGRIPITSSLNDIAGTDQYWYVTEPGVLEDVINLNGLYFTKKDYTGYTVGIVIDPSNDKSKIEYSWYASSDGGETFQCISGWKTGDEWLSWTPDKYGDYTLMGKVRLDGDDGTIRETSEEVSYHPAIKGKCQMPYTGQGGGFLIGVESYDNPNQSYSYEMLILDCTLLAQNKPAWIYTTGKCRVSEGNAMWTIWQPKYGYYWTLFRVYDQDGNLIDQECYGFVNT